MRCEPHGRDMIRLGDSLVCPACLAAASAPAARLVDEARVRMQDLSTRKRLAEAGLPRAFEASSFANFEAVTPRAQQVASVLSSYVSRFASQREARSGFLFTGAPGTGKTHLACAMVHALVEGGFRAAYASLPRLTSDLRGAIGRAGAQQSIVATLVDMDFLVLDEIDLHGQSDNDYNTLYDIINRRYERPGFPTLAISNRSLERLVTDLDERVVSRILGTSKPIHFDWQSRRDVRLGQRPAGPQESR